MSNTTKRSPGWPFDTPPPTAPASTPEPTVQGFPLSFVQEQARARIAAEKEASVKFVGQGKKGATPSYDEPQPTRGVEPIEPPAEPIETPVQFLITHADPKESQKLSQIIDFQYDPSKVGVTTVSFEARQEAESKFQTQVLLAQQSLTTSKEEEFRKRFVQDGQITDTEEALQYLLEFSDPTNTSRLQSSIAELEAHPLVIGETSKTRLEKEQQEAITQAWESLTPKEQEEYMKKFPELFPKTPEQLAFESEREAIHGRITGEPGERVAEMARFTSGVFIKSDTLLKTMGQIFFGGEEKGERILDIMAEQSMAFKGSVSKGILGIPELFIESYKPGGFGFTVSLAAITFGAGKAALPALAAKGAGSAILAKGVPLAIGGGFSAMAGAQIGQIAALEEVGLAPKGATAEAAFTYGGYFALFIGGGAIAAKGTPTWILKKPLSETFPRITEWKVGLIESHRMKLMVKDYPFHRIEGTRVPISYGLKSLGIRIKSVAFEPSTLRYMQMYSDKQSFLFTRQPPSRLPGLRDISFLKEFSRVPTKYSIHAEQIAIQKQLRFKLDLMKDVRIKTETKVIVDPKDPLQAFFKTTRIDTSKDIFSAGEIRQIGQTFGGKISFKPTSARGIKKIFALEETAQQGQISTITGKTYYKLSPKDVFYQEKPFVGFVSSKSLRDIGGYTSTRTYGLTLQDRGVIISRGFTLQKDYFAGESFIEQGSLGGYFKQIKHDMSIALTKGAFRSRLTGGIYEDIMGTLKPKLPGSGEYYGELGGFDYRVLPKGAIDRLVMPGGVGETSTVKPLPGLFESTYQKPLTLSQLEALESGIASYSTYWSGVRPQITPILGIAPISALSQIKISKATLASKPALGQIQIQTPLSIQLQNVSQLQSQSLTQSQVQLQSQSLTQSQIQQQVQLQKQLQVQLTKQVQLQKQISVQMQMQMLLTPTPQISITRMGTPSVPISPEPTSIVPRPPIMPVLFPTFGFEDIETKKGQAFNVMVRERRFFKGKELKEGKFIKINKVPLSEFGALSFGATIIDNSAARTFKIVKTTGKPKQPIINIDPWNFLQMKFIKKGDRYIEQDFAAIDSPGEIEGISALGWMAERHKASRIAKPRTVRVKHEEIIGFEMPDPFVDFNKLFKRFDLGF